MSGPSSAREALLFEALGEVAILLERVETVAPAMDASRLALISASTELTHRVGVFESRMAALTDNAQVQAIKHIARRIDELAHRSLDAQTQAMEDAARTIFRAEVGPALQRTALPLQQLAALAQDSMRPWNRWLTHVATAVLTSALSWAMAAWLWLR